MSSPGMLRNALQFGALPKRESVFLIGRGEIFVDTRDNRGRAILDCAGMTQPFTTALWRRLIKIIDPEIVLDIGANYGEIALSSTYGLGTQIHLFEPNPYVRAYLNKSILSRKDVRDVHLHPELVEFGRNYLQRAGTDPDELVRYFAEHGVLQGVYGNRISERIGQLPDHFDLLVASSSSILAQANQLGIMRCLFRQKP